MFLGMPVIFERYDKGADLGAQQYIARVSDDAFQVNMTSRCFFHREGWLRHLVNYRNHHGPSLYGVSTSKEGSTNGWYVCTRGHTYDVEDFKLYPHDIHTKDQGMAVECGDMSISRWFENIGRKCLLSTWDGCYPLGTIIENAFRNGNQEQMLVWDRHTEIYAEADPKEKKRLAEMAYDNDKVE